MKLLSAVNTHIWGWNLTLQERMTKNYKANNASKKKTIGCFNFILWSSGIGKKRKYNIYETLIKSNLSYGARTWTITENNKKLEATKMDVFRQKLRISRKDKIKNENIRQRMKVNEWFTINGYREKATMVRPERTPETRLPTIIMQ